MENKLRMYGLVMECPFGVECSDCPIQDLRKLKDFEKQVEIIDNMTQKSLNEVVKFHDECRVQRENDLWNIPIEETKKFQKND